MKLHLQRFATAGSLVNTTAGHVNAHTGEAVNTSAMSGEMKTYYDTELLENTRKELIFSQLCRKQPLPAGHGRQVEWRKWNTFPQAGKLTEGVVPTGEKFGMTTLTAQVNQYGLYATISDQLEMHAIDDVILGCAEEMGASAADTIDALARAEMLCGLNVMYCDTLDENGLFLSTPRGRFDMKADNNRLTPDMVNKAVTFLKKQKAPKIDGKYVAIIHPSVSYDLRSSPEWIDAHKYAAPEEIYNGEIGELHGVRFIETSDAKVWAGSALSENSRFLTLTEDYTQSDTALTAPLGEASAYRVTVSETPGEELVGRFVHLWDQSAGDFVSSNRIVGVDTENKFLWLETALGVSPEAGDLFYPGEGGQDTDGPCAVYATLFLGRDAVADIDPEGMSLEMIIKDRREAGGPLNQFSTVGYKLEDGVKILYQERLLRVESCSAYSRVDEEN